MDVDQQPALFDLAALTDVGTEREHNEDCCGTLHVDAAHALVVVADGVSGNEGGEIASQKAVETTIQAYREQAADVAAAKRLARAVQQANIEIHDMALVIPELRGMATTITAVALVGGELVAAHVGDSRLFLLRDGRLSQLTKDHTVPAERARMGLLKKEKVQSHPDRSTLTRSLGREMIASIDRLSAPVGRGDRLVVCTDGLYNVLPEEEIARLAAAPSAADAVRAIIDAANSIGTPDNLTAAVLRVSDLAPELSRPRESRFARMMKTLMGRRPSSVDDRA